MAESWEEASHQRVLHHITPATSQISFISSLRLQYLPVSGDVQKLHSFDASFKASQSQQVQCYVTFQWKRSPECSQKSNALGLTVPSRLSFLC